MSSLSSYSLETDQIVLLKFSDGSSLRVTHDQLDGLVAAEELRSIHRSIEKRANFIKDSLPIWARTIVMSIGVGLLGWGTVQAGHRVWQQLKPPPMQQAAPEKKIAPRPAVGSSPAPTRSPNTPAAPTASPAPGTAAAIAIQRVQQAPPLPLPTSVLPNQPLPTELPPVLNGTVVPKLQLPSLPPAAELLK